MAHYQTRRIGDWLERLSERATAWTGSSWGFASALAIILAWGALGPLFAYSDTWQLVINTGTTIVTFLMVFLLQRSQNKAALAVHLKLNEVVAALDGASNRLIDVEDLGEEELEALHEHFRCLVAMAKRAGRLTESHSVEEAERRHHEKSRNRSR